MFIDTHAHLMMQQFEGEVSDIVLRAKDAGVERIINIGMDELSSAQALELAHEFDGCFATFGFHPYEAKNATDSVMNDWKKIIENSAKVIGIGECGLDFVKTEVDRSVQEKAFRMQLELAQATSLPVVVHSRGAERECLDILKDYTVDAVFHCYGGDVTVARDAWEAGFYTSFTGIITFPNAAELCEIVKEVPMDRFLIETDCPFLAPQAHRGKRNEPSFVVEVAKKIAELKGIPLGEVEEFAFNNTEKFFPKLI
ncbi:hydrolase TatD [Candidatus Peregrinibacteria bacterium CG10_big_fil_rev_8_21_14_0_10_36_19]|nr:MAG: hydrolase TatD [Candidatus Peregrinibacteria bacterium CG10_big_fil_rev_8_21_14_0_10_36_19]